MKYVTPKIRTIDVNLKTACMDGSSASANACGSGQTLGLSRCTSGGAASGDSGNTGCDVGTVAANTDHSTYGCSTGTTAVQSGSGAGPGCATGTNPASSACLTGATATT